MLSLICAETNLLETTAFKRSQTVLSAILQNYSAFNITTIDSFTHKLIRTFAYDLELPLNSDVEMDTESLLNEAVDVVISKIGEDTQLTNLLINYAIQKLDDDKSWDISNRVSYELLFLNDFIIGVYKEGILHSPLIENLNWDPSGSEASPVSEYLLETLLFTLKILKSILIGL